MSYLLPLFYPFRAHKVLHNTARGWSEQPPPLEVGDEVEIIHLRPLPSSTLSTVAIRPSRSFDISAHVLRELELLSKCTNGGVQHIYIDTLVNLKQPLRPLTRFHKLRTLEVSALDPGLLDTLIELLLGLASLENLWILTGTERSASSIVDNSNELRDLASQPTGFCTLRKLSLYIPLSNIRSPLDEEASPDALLSKNRTTSLRKLELTLYHRCPSDKPLHAPIFQLFRPLLRLSNLEWLELVFENRLLSISDDDVADMTYAWPKIRHLIVQSEISRHHNDAALWQASTPAIQRPSLLAIAKLAGCCRNLKELTMDVANISAEDVDAFEAWAAVPERVSQTRSSLTTLGSERHREQLTLTDVDRLARALRRLFPSLKRRVENTIWVHLNGVNLTKTDALRLMMKLDEL
ncbi:hypothetical protein BD413DRAFT_491580 [Trametes elegans]|nr:hypothetical protein BD413DRAFT_491580 [Trametes elegans]